MHNITKKAAQTLIAVVLFSLLIASPAQAQETDTQTAFAASDIFSIPGLNGNIRFGFNGTYTEAKLENNTWFFKGLEINNTEATAAYGFPDVVGLKDITISAENSNITILGCVSFNYSWMAQAIMYTVEGLGSQTVNLGVYASQSTSVDEWSVLVDNGATFLAEGSGWKLLEDNSIKVNAGTGNVTVMHFDFGDDPAMANLSFVMQHYLIILTGVVLAVVVVSAVLIKVRRKRKTLRISEA
ncbi:MAG TPA: hypothetical protein VLH35_05440 [Candidatus Acidoferrales bacterium]|nr:hypothetical protein [Candidatus Acidoferrales bacterium]